jgi:hypothetical protein
MLSVLDLVYLGTGPCQLVITQLFCWKEGRNEDDYDL